MNLQNYLKARAANDASTNAAIAETAMDVGELQERVAVIEAGQAVSAISFVALAESGTIDAATAAEHANVFDEWKPNVNYQHGQYRQDNGILYVCLQDHTSQDNWRPANTPALWKVAADPADEWPEWSQPIGAGDAYMKDDKTSHNGKHWISEYDNNIWEPGVYGWYEVNE